MLQWFFKVKTDVLLNVIFLIWFCVYNLSAEANKQNKYVLKNTEYTLVCLIFWLIPEVQLLSSLLDGLKEPSGV